MHKREIWSSKHNLSSRVTPSNLTHDTGFIVSFDIFNSQIATVFEDNCLEFGGVCFHLVFSKPVLRRAWH